MTVRIVQASSAAIALFLILLAATGADPRPLLAPLFAPKQEVASAPGLPALPVGLRDAAPAPSGPFRAGIQNYRISFPFWQASGGIVTSVAAPPARPDSPNDPVRIRIARMTLDNPIEPVATVPGRAEIAVTNAAETVGWYAGSPRPGEPGASVLAGHRDWGGRKGSFYDLNTLAPGDVIEVGLRNGTSERFVVFQSELYATAKTPGAGIFRTAGPSSLLLISCEGAFDVATHDYTHRRVVLAVAQSATGGRRA